MTSIVKLPIDDTTYNFRFDKKAAADPEFDQILRDLVRQIGPLRRGPDRAFDDAVVDPTICFSSSQARLIAGVGDGLAQDPTLTPAQVTALSNLFVSIQGLSAGRELPLASSPSALAAQAVRAVHHDGYSYIVSMPTENEDAGEVLFFCNDDNAAGVDWGDFVLELVVGVVSVALALGAATNAVGRLTRALRRSDLFDRLKALLRSPTFREKLKKFADLIPGGKRVTEIYEALKGLLSDLWDIVIKPSYQNIKDALASIVSPWTIFWSILSWLLRFLSGGSAIIAEIGVLLGTLTVKVLRPESA